MNRTKSPEARLGTLPARVLGAMLVALLTLSASPARAQDEIDQPIEIDPFERAEPVAQDGQAFQIDRFVIEYVSPHPDHPDLGDLELVEIELLQTGRGFVAPRAGLPTVTTTIADINAQPARTYYTSGVLEVAESLVRYFNRQGVIGVFIAPRELNLRTGQDARAPGDGTVTLEVYTVSVSQVRSIASGNRVDSEDRINSAKHTRIRDNSPVSADGAGNLLRRDRLDRYVNRLNRHPGRRVDVAVSPDTEPGTAVLDYLIYEAKPWTIYAQVDNTGTEQTEEIRTRFGFVHNQLFGFDDILTIDYVTAGFDSANAIFGTYEFPIGVDGMRGKVFGSYSEYEASDVGQVGNDFSGESFGVGGEVIWNVYQDGQFFADVYAGFRFQNYTVDSPLGQDGEADAFYPGGGVRFERIVETDAFTADIGFEAAIGDEDDFETIGRVNPDEFGMILTWDARYSLYLEPLFNYDAWADPSTPGSSTLAHEVAFRLSGQNALGTRLIPNDQSVMGGLYTVRGFEESVVAGDNSFVASAEYRFHLPRVFAIEEEPRQLFGRNFRFAPQQVYGRPDWDLVLKGFVDVGYVDSNEAELFEDEETLVSAGVGVDFSLRRNVIARVDWGFVLDGIEDDSDNDDGSNRIHFVVTVLY